jgi:quercetin 2,3-dioxygenase
MQMIEHITRQEVPEDDWGWIQMRSPVLHNQPYGTLAVFTDGLMHSGKGFDMHPHRNLEIVSVILEGEVTHQDSTGNVTKMQAGSVQRITSGSGIYHAEHTTSPEAARMYQIWFVPHTFNLKPDYVRTSFQETLQKNKLHPIVTHSGETNALTMSADGSIYVADFEAGRAAQYALQPDRKLFVFVADGSLRIEDKVLSRQDHARIQQVTSVTLEAVTAVQFIVIDVPVADQRLY